MRASSLRPALLFSSKRQMSSTPSVHRKVLTKESINPLVVKAKYAVRGEIPIKADELRHEIRTNSDHNLPFDNIISANIGNPQQLGQKGLTYLRQVSALTDYPDLMDSPLCSQLFPADVVKRAKTLLEEIGSTGAYTHSKGIHGIRQDVANFLKERDGYDADPELLYLTGGASDGVSRILSIIVSDPSVGVLIPIPQYPLYTATLTLNHAHACPYYLNEEADWATSIHDVRESLYNARKNDIDVRAIVVINPGNPTGACLTEQQIADILKLAHDESLVVLADEVYQTNIFLPDHKPFVSFKKALRSLGEPYASSVELVSFHSTSKGQIGECGRRGGYFELVNFDPQVEAELFKLSSISLCSPVSGQIAVDIMVNPPKPGEESYELYQKEIDNIASSLKHRSSTLLESFRNLEGVQCQDAQGAMYLFPRIDLPPKAVEAAKKEGKQPDEFYCLKLLESTGICLVPGSGFGQEDGTWHFRTTFLAPEIDDYCSRIADFHAKFMDTYR